MLIDLTFLNENLEERQCALTRISGSNWPSMIPLVVIAMLGSEMAIKQSIDEQ